MAWKDVLVFADTTEQGACRAKVAADLAASQSARLSIAVFSHRKLAGSRDPKVRTGAAAHAIAEADAKKVATGVEDYAPAMKGKVVAIAPVDENDDCIVVEEAGELSAASDIVVAGYPSDAPEHKIGQQLFEGVLLRGGRPCIALPAWTEVRPIGRRILVAWTSTREAARAVHDALPLLRRAEEVQIFVSGAGADFDSRGPRGLARLEDHLKQHGVKLAAPCIADGHQDIAHLIKHHAANFKADLIVMGGYGRSPLEELITGGVTRKLVDEHDVPVLFSH